MWTTSGPPPDRAPLKLGAWKIPKRTQDSRTDKEGALLPLISWASIGAQKQLSITFAGTRILRQIPQVHLAPHLSWVSAMWCIYWKTQGRQPTPEMIFIHAPRLSRELESLFRNLFGPTAIRLKTRMIIQLLICCQAF